MHINTHIRTYIPLLLSDVCDVSYDDGDGGDDACVCYENVLTVFLNDVLSVCDDDSCVHCFLLPSLFNSLMSVSMRERERERER